MATKALEEMRQSKDIGNSLEAEVTVYCVKQETCDFLLSFGPALADLFNVSKTFIKIVETLPDDAVRDERSPGVGIKVTKTSDQKCERCWRYTEEVGSFQDHLTICGRCREVLENR